MSGLAEHGAALLGGRLARPELMGGGNLSSVIRTVLGDGRVAIAMDGPAPLVEAAMLRVIREAKVREWREAVIHNVTRTKTVHMFS